VHVAHSGSVTECMVRTVTAKGKVVVKPKHMSRRSPEEEEFLDDLVSWIVHSGTTGKEEVFSYRRSRPADAHDRANGSGRA
jgi:hypothetical protein